MTTPLTATVAASGVRKWIVGALAAGILVTVAGAGTFASFSASTTNADNTFSTGALSLGNQVDNGTFCYTDANGQDLSVNDRDCSAAFTLDLQRPGATATSTITIENNGDYNGTLSLFGACASTRRQGESADGGGNLCSGLRMMVQEVESDLSTPVACRFGTVSGTSCSAGAALNTLPTTSGTAVAVGALEHDTNGGANGSPNGFRYFDVTVTFPDTADDNAFQNLTASFDLTWNLVEAA